MNAPEPSLTLDLAEAARLCKCSTHLLSRLARSGAVPATKVGRRWVFPTRLLQEWLDERSRANLGTWQLGGVLRRGTVTQALTATGASDFLDERLQELRAGAPPVRRRLR